LVQSLAANSLLTPKKSAESANIYDLNIIFTLEK